MAYGICYTQSGSTKKYEPDGLNRPDQVKWITGYTVGYPSTAYYPGILCDNFYLFTYDNFPPEMYKDFPDFTEGSAIYFFSPRIYTMPSDLEPNNNSYISYNRIYNLMSYTPPNGYVLSENGPYTYTAIATVYSCNEDVEYYTAINTVNIGTDTIKREFKYKKKDSKVYVRLLVSTDIIINGNTYHSYENRPAINTIDLESGASSVTNILVGLDSNHSTGAFDISFEGASVSNKKIYLLVNNNYYDVTNSTSNENKRCYISKYGDRFHIVGWMYTTAGFDYTFSSNDWENNSLFTQEGTKDSFGGYIPDNRTAKFVVKFALSNGYSHKDCQLTVDVTTNK